MSFPNQCDIENLNVNTAFRHFSVVVDKARADKPVLFGSLELLELCPQGAEGSGGEH